MARLQARTRCSEDGEVVEPNLNNDRTGARAFPLAWTRHLSCRGPEGRGGGVRERALDLAESGPSAMPTGLGGALERRARTRPAAYPRRCRARLRPRARAARRATTARTGGGRANAASYASIALPTSWKSGWSSWRSARRSFASAAGVGRARATITRRPRCGRARAALSPSRAPTNA